MRRLSLALLLAIGTAACSLAQVTEQQIVKNAFPPELRSSEDLHPREWSTFVSADLSHSGQRMLIALYSNGYAAALRALDGGGNVLAAPDVPGLNGRRGTLRLVDLDNDGTPEIVAQLYAGVGLDLPESWIFRWNGKLNLISPVVEGDGSAFGRITFGDLDGDGKIEVVAAPALRRDDSGQYVPVGPWHVYHVNSDGNLAELNKALVFSEEYRRYKGTPDSISHTFPGVAGASTTMTIVNGVNGIGADSARITLNGAEVVAPSEFKKKQRTILVPVQLAASNEIIVTLGSKPDASIWITIDEP